MHVCVYIYIYFMCVCRCVYIYIYIYIYIYKIRVREAAPTHPLVGLWVQFNSHRHSEAKFALEDLITSVYTQQESPPLPYRPVGRSVGQSHLRSPPPSCRSLPCRGGSLGCGSIDRLNSD